ncbi:MAG: energy-coupling factor transporter transmembrane protein EcfT [Clostridiales bacterium]|jgi:energy-coupling factor transport system permease protein|nr:energy-coupling factor transporter transmembrane protein EcfT [Clostridiales bacterium]
MNRAFSGLHPWVSVCFFAAVLGVTMTLTHPVFLALSVCGAAACLWTLRGRKGMAAWKFITPLLLLTAALNPVFNHEGATILRYLPDGNPLTAESILYGVAAAGMLTASLLWFLCLSEVMTSDKVVYLFGRVIPALSLLLSMTLRFIPRLKHQARVISNAQVCVGRGTSEGNLLTRARHTLTVFGMLLTWAFESAISTADSMKSRGYGLPGRSAFSLWRFDRRDAVMLSFIALCTGAVILGCASGQFAWRYYPLVSGTLTGIVPVLLYILYAALCFLPVGVELWEARKWRALRSAI